LEFCLHLTKKRIVHKTGQVHRKRGREREREKGKGGGGILKANSESHTCRGHALLLAFDFTWANKTRQTRQDKMESKKKETTSRAFPRFHTNHFELKTRERFVHFFFSLILAILALWLFLFIQWDNIMDHLS
jgi:hypothetical protein